MTEGPEDMTTRLPAGSPVILTGLRVNHLDPPLTGSLPSAFARFASAYGVMVME